MTAAGDTLGGRYRLRASIAVGGMGEVWEAVDEVLGRDVAVKLLKPEYGGDRAFRTRFRSEARYAGGLSHPGIAQVYDYAEEDDRPYLVMELVPGEPLSARLQREGRLSSISTLEIVGQAARALRVAHDAGIIHRDIKPGNLILTPDGRVKITDFGIARAAQASSLTQTGKVMGTAQYVSPEQASGKQVTPSSDLYSLGIVAYECLAGHPPFQADNPVTIALAHVRDEPPELPEDVPGPVAALVRAMLAKDPRDRPASGQDLAEQAFGLLGIGGRLSDRGTVPAPADDEGTVPATRSDGAPPRNTKPEDAVDPASTGEPGEPGESEHERGGRFAEHRKALIGVAVGVAVVALGAVTAAALRSHNAPADMTVHTPTHSPSSGTPRTHSRTPAGGGAPGTGTFEPGSSPTAGPSRTAPSASESPSPSSTSTSGTPTASVGPPKPSSASPKPTQTRSRPAPSKSGPMPTAGSPTAGAPSPSGTKGSGQVPDD